jgi:hypothetical protein
MRNKDAIFWSAAAIFVLAIILFAVFQNQLWLFLMVGSYLLRPTLASLGVNRRKIDERQMSIHYRSGNIAFAVMIVGAIIMSAVQASKDDHSFELFNVLVIAGLAAKAVFNVILIKNYRQAASRIVMGVGLMWTLFASMEGGFSLGTIMESLPGLLIIAIGWAAPKFPRVVGVIIFALTAALMVLILHKGFTVGQVTTAILIGIPLGMAGWSLFLPDRYVADSEDEPVTTP